MLLYTKILVIRVTLFLLFVFMCIYGYGYENRIIAYVNNDVITSFELKNRMRIVELLNNNRTSKNNVSKTIQSLIDEKLLLQIANIKDLYILDKQVYFYLQNMLNDRKLANINAVIKKYEIDKTHLIHYIRLQLLIKKFVEYKIQPETIVSNYEVADTNEIAYRVQSLVPMGRCNNTLKLYEIVIYKDKTKIKDIKKTLHTIYTLFNNGVPFQDLAKQFSQSKTSINNGFLGWVRINKLSKSITYALNNNFDIDSISNPINVKRQIIILNINNTKKLSSWKKILTSHQMKSAIYNKKLNDNLKFYIQELRKKSYIKIIVS